MEVGMDNVLCSQPENSVKTAHRPSQDMLLLRCPAIYKLEGSLCTHTMYWGKRKGCSPSQGRDETTDLHEAECRGMYTARPHHSHMLQLVSPCIKAAQHGGSCWEREGIITARRSG